jgi:hypothetical protein
VSKENPRSDEWAEWYTFHPEVVATYSEAQGSLPPHEWLCPDNTSRPTRPEESLFPDEPLPVADPNTHCWCNAFCAFCRHHADHHDYQIPKGAAVPCRRCEDGFCKR